MPKLVVMLRVKDAISFIHEWLACFEKLVDEVVALDNGSTDGTCEILQAHPKVVDLARTEGYNEGRDKDILYAMLRKRNPDWCLWVDVDEIFEPELTRADFDRLMKRKYVNKYGFRRFHFIDKDHFAGSGEYFYWTSMHDRVMWREQPTGYFESVVFEPPPNVQGISGVRINTNFRLKHLGYIYKKEVDKKANIYRALLDPKDHFYLDRMYLDKVKKVRWYDDRGSLAVWTQNARLNWIQLVSLFPRAVNKLSRILHKQFQRPQTQAT